MRRFEPWLGFWTPTLTKYWSEVVQQFKTLCAACTWELQDWITIANPTPDLCLQVSHSKRFHLILHKLHLTLVSVDRSMSVIATEDIPKDSQITTSYMEPFYTTMQRRALLRKGKCFDCDCSRCADPTELNSYRQITQFFWGTCFWKLKTPAKNADFSKLYKTAGT